MTTSPESRAARRPSTIRDVAALAGVSKSTASRALLGQPGVSPENYEKVQLAITELDFTPNQIARSLSVHSPAILGLFIRQSASPFYAHLAQAFEEQAGMQGYEVLTVASGDQPDEANYRSLMVLADLRTAGIVVAAPNVAPPTIRKIASRVPLVLVGQMGQAENPDVPSIAPDPNEGATLIDHLVALGHTAIALTTYPQERSPTQWARVMHMQKTLTARGLQERLVILQPDTDIDELTATLHRSGVTAVLCNNDWIALDMIASAGRLGLSVPADISIAGHDGIPPFDHEAIGLTTYRVPIADMATVAIERIGELLRGEDIGRKAALLAGDLLPGRTTGTVRAT
jgi:DNA-binding LacI/PurR family transcriptional regulator